MRMSRNSRAIRAMPSVAVLACVLLAGCSSPTPPDEERRPEPQAQPQSPPKSALLDTANAYKGAARASVTATEDAAKREQAELDAAAQ